MRDPNAIAAAVIEILGEGRKTRFVPEEFLEKFQQEAVARRNEAWMETLLADE